jgi:hypothetical protein
MLPISAQKNQLIIAERIAILAAGACAAGFAFCWFERSFAHFVMPAVFVTFAVVFYLALLIAGLMSELSSCLGKTTATRPESAGFSLREIALQLQWSPLSYKIAALISIAGIVAKAIIFGSVSWTTGEPFTQRHAIASLLYIFFIINIELPVVASASRMPGTFVENMQQFGSDET